MSDEMEKMMGDLVKTLHERDTREVARQVEIAAGEAMKSQIPPQKVYASLVVAFREAELTSMNCSRLAAAAITLLAVQRMAGGQAS